MQKAGRAQKQAKQPKQRKQPKSVQKVAKRAASTKKQSKIAQSQSFAPVQVQQRTFATNNVTIFKPKLTLPSPFQKSFGLQTIPSFTPFKQQKRNMSVLTGMRLRTPVPCDPRFEDDEVISMLNTKTGLIEPIIVVVPEISFEWVFSSPCDLHTFDVIPVVKDCIDPANPTFESMDA